jgi:hypothetical protein
MGERGEISGTHTVLLQPPLFCPSWIAFLWRRPKIETHYNNMCLPLRINGDAPAFGTKERCAHPSNQRCVSSNTCLTLVTIADTFFILHKLRRTAKTCISFSPPCARPVLPPMGGLRSVSPVQASNGLTCWHTGLLTETVFPRIGDD